MEAPRQALETLDELAVPAPEAREAHVTAEDNGTLDPPGRARRVPDEEPRVRANASLPMQQRDFRRHLAPDVDRADLVELDAGEPLEEQPVAIGFRPEDGAGKRAVPAPLSASTSR